MRLPRSGGMLLHITSLPGPYGAGTMGKSAEAFVNQLGACGIRFWQTLPLGPPQAGHSPYQCFSAFAGNPVLIDPDRLVETGTVTEEEAGSNRLEPGTAHADFECASRLRDGLLRISFSRLDEDTRHRVRSFVGQNREWAVDYAWFQTIRGHFNGLPWWEWPDEDLRTHMPEALEDFVWKHADEVFYQMYVQYEFYRQWDLLKEIAKAAGVKMFGDMPVYVARDSSDVWSHTRLFELDRDFSPIRVAGVPPDYFSKDGQRWGNPLYRWDVLRSEDYAWWIERIRNALHLFDAVRIDHFRGFESYWAIPATQETAKDGEWVSGPAMDLFSRIAETYPDACVIAEDLGHLTADTRSFLDATGYPGMRILQFAFDGSADNVHLPHKYVENCVAYVGTHDNHTLCGWLDQADKRQRTQSNAYCRVCDTGRDTICRAWIETLWSSVARIAIITPQDLLAMEDSRRMNVPGVAEGNWTFRLTQAEMGSIDYAWLRQLSRRYGRA